MILSLDKWILCSLCIGSCTTTSFFISTIVGCILDVDGVLIRYKQNTARASSMLRDQQQKPVERAIFWTEYVLRHDTAALRLSSRELALHQQTLIDVYAFIFLVTLASLAMLVFLCRKFGCRSSHWWINENKWHQWKISSRGCSMNDPDGQTPVWDHNAYLDKAMIFL